METSIIAKRKPTKRCAICGSRIWGKGVYLKQELLNFYVGGFSFGDMPKRIEYVPIEKKCVKLLIRLANIEKNVLNNAESLTKEFATIFFNLKKQIKIKPLVKLIEFYGFSAKRTIKQLNPVTQTMELVKPLKTAQDLEDYYLKNRDVLLNTLTKLGYEIN